MDSSTVPPPPTVVPAAEPPLVVDLDGTLIRTDMLHESSVRLFRDAPLATLRIPGWLAAGKAVLKRELAERTPFDAAVLPYNTELLAWLGEQHRAGRRLVLCTATDDKLAREIAAHCGIFDEVLASDGTTNLDGQRKAEALVRRFGAGGFDYAGNATVDLAVWPHARRAIVVNARPSVLAGAQACCAVEKVFPSLPVTTWTWVKLVRAHQWLKNALLFAPLFAAHQVDNLDAWVHLLLAFAAFSLCASSVYVANDLMDLESDRHHPRKRARPFAAGTVQIWVGVLLVPLLATASLALALLVNLEFLGWLAIYFALTWAYSWRLKRVVLVDCLTLAGLYTLRVVAGAAAASLALSFWLLAFSGFLFLSLAFVKRYAELQAQAAEGRTHAHGRAYLTSDAPLIQVLGIVSGYTAVVVLALYLNTVLRFYARPEFVWATVPIMVWWVSWMWLRAFRGDMHDDPLVFAFRDKASVAAGVLFGAVLFLGTSWPW
ncbi:UbiA family prenyltransferase [Caenimonas sedimenti]|uniref:UbiA family prenyltransferase n=1 Tax=Caenimonas sedimenti TaxID=2596921 RepID=UPI002105E57F|nr:UbiA family prenyltransferase [Caenimonas sedimenti]